eukprot:TRINITY_DN30038_c0_g1_i1.p1 TRINITY_DN30038_c0_g1~~TRINITY_DN30038_c0_g1_i1.p1  ORF type:complete len:159 (+),score=28.74 TRINITY_DN30038_c0_g1_i1:35-478(+)
MGFATCLREGALLTVVVADFMLLFAATIGFAPTGGEVAYIIGTVGIAICMISFLAMWNRKWSVPCQVLGLMGMWALTIPVGYEIAKRRDCDNCKSASVRAACGILACFCHYLYVNFLQKKPPPPKHPTATRTRREEAQHDTEEDECA